MLAHSHAGGTSCAAARFKVSSPAPGQVGGARADACACLGCQLVEEADGYQPYLLSPEKGLRALVKKCLDLAKPPSLQCVDEVHRTLLEVVSAAAAATPGLSRYPPLRRCIVELASAALDAYRGEAKTMVVALVDMERSFIHPTKFRKLVQRRLEKLAYEEDMKETAKTQEQSLLSKVRPPGGTSRRAPAVLAVGRPYRRYLMWAWF